MRSIALAIASLISIAFVAAGCDPVQSDAVNALGGEAPGVPNGPLHRPGQPCLLCHEGDFSVAGTVYRHPEDTTGLAGVSVALTGADGSKVSAVTNAAGNFYLNADTFSPAFPMQAAITYDGKTVTMVTTIGRDGSCASCHVDPAGPGSPGRVSISFDDGGALP